MKTIQAVKRLNVSVTQAAEILGKSPQFIRIGLQRELLPIGTAVKMSSIWTYHISPKLLEEYVGLPEGYLTIGAESSVIDRL